LARDWNELFELARPVAREPGGAEAPAESRHPGMFRRLRENLARSRRALAAEVQATLAGDPHDEGTWERLEELLIYADVGARTTGRVVEQLEREAEAGEVEGAEGLTERLQALLAQIARPQDDGRDRISLVERPTVILAVGVNGTGKTTTIGKLAWHLRRTIGVSVLIAAADTYRAAAVEQLEEWARRAECEFVRGARGADPGSVAYDAVAAARARGSEVVILDTAGRLHTQDELMAELRKVCRVIAKQLPGAPHETLLTVDATTGQNGLRQARVFAEAVAVTGIVLTKLDGTAKGGIALAIADELGIPVKLIGVGEALEDLRPFDPDDFACALLGTGQA
jgi:fused signal recognition particle receptor